MTELTASDMIREKREAIVRIAARHGDTQVRLIGSVARGEARPESDVDLLVTWSEDSSLLDQTACWSLKICWAGKSTLPVTVG